MRPISMDCSSEYFQPGGHGARMCRNRIPRVAAALRTLSSRSTGYDGHAVAAYGMLCAAMMPRMSFLRVDCGWPAGVVVVHAPHGVADDRWIPVFMYASLS